MTLSEKIEKLRICVIVPTYNNCKTLGRVLEGILAQTTHVIVVNDGSTDATAEILSQYPQIQILHLPQNRGKGNALKTGFAKARELGYDYAITIDSDGQHFPEDISRFVVNIAEATQPVLLIGSRDMNQEGVPKNSSFGNRFSNFWFWFETGIWLQDTQSGYRAYPLHRLPNKLYTRKFEFEIEIIVRSAWKGVLVKNIPIQVLYDPQERVSHFRPMRDFTRISILNTVLVIISLFYIKPRDFIRNFRKKSIKKFIREDILESNTPKHIKAISIGFGVFMGIVPLWGLQTILVITLSVLFRLNKVLAFAFSNISIPPMIPFVIFASLKTGSLFVSEDTSFIFDKKLDFELVKEHLKQYFIGAVVLAIIAGLVSGFVSYLLLSLKGNKSTH
ncbi:MAG TPA: DUF2062 domain-containing protein [Flavobacteriaceae bacterium]|nr:DUF2062 domain-containing protein [Flavobacteriaceae bacterium]